MFKTKSISGRRSSARLLVFTRITVLSLAGMLAGCGGGGGGGGGVGGGAGGGGGEGATPPLVYTGNLNPAAITTSNAAILTANIFGGADSSVAFSAAAPSTGSGASDVTRTLTRAVHATPLPAASRAPRVTSEPVDFGIQGCINGGSVHTFGNLNVSGTGTLTFIWSNCGTAEGSTLDGTATIQVDAVDPSLGPDGTITDGTFTFHRVAVTTPNGNGTVSGTVRSQIDAAQRSEIDTSNLITLDSSGKLTMTQDYKVRDVFDDILLPTRINEETIEGRLYDETHGFVVISTSVPLVFDSTARRFPQSGELVLAGANSSHIRATSQSSTALTLALDVNGDGIEERTVTLAWTDLGGPAGTDLRDTDGDGMHDSWERAYGLLPNVNDMDADLDHDGATNVTEYRAGTKPNDPNSIPANLAPAAGSLSGI